jgi:hypothetical protein
VEKKQNEAENRKCMGQVVQAGYVTKIMPTANVVFG